MIKQDTTINSTHKDVAFAEREKVRYVISVLRDIPNRFLGMKISSTYQGEQMPDVTIVVNPYLEIVKEINFVAENAIDNGERITTFVGDYGLVKPLNSY